MEAASHFTERGVRAVYNRAFAQAASRRPKFADAVKVLPSGQRLESYAWANAAPLMSRWEGDKRFTPITTHRQEIINADWQVTLPVDRNLIEDDQIGGIMQQIETMGMLAAWNHVRVAIREVLLQNPVAHDGQKLIANTAGNRKFDNDLDGSGIDLANLAEDLEAAETAMMLFQGDNGEPFEWMPNAIVCHPKLRRRFEMLMTSRTLPVATGSQGDRADTARAAGAAEVGNPYMGEYMVIPEPRLGLTGYRTGADSRATVNSWYLLATMYPVGPIVWQERKAPRFVSNTRGMMGSGGADMSDAEYMRRELRYGAEARGEAAAGIPSMIVRTYNA